MAAPTELSIDEIRNFIVARGGKVTNHDLVKHFKPFLTNAETRDEARDTFKKYVNLLGSIKNENGEKYIVLKRKKTLVGSDNNVSMDSVSEDMNASKSSLVAEPIVEPPIVREPPPYRPPPVITSPSSESYRRIESSPQMSYTPQVQAPHVQAPEVVRPVLTPDPETEDNVQLRRDLIVNQADPPALPERRKSSVSSDQQDSVSDNVSASSYSGAIKKQRKVQEGMADNFNTSSETEQDNKENRLSSRSDSSRSLNMDNDQQGAVKVHDRVKKFNKIANTEKNGVKSLPQTKIKRKNENDEFSGSNASLNQESHTWIMKSAMGDYQALAKMANEDPKLLKVKDPATTALHWAAKHGNEDIVKLVAGKCPSIVNQRSGYTPLHISMQLHHEGVFSLLRDVYKADQTLRDWSGRRAQQYRVTEDTSVSAETYRKIKAYRQKQADKQKDTKFLRIGSLNLRVKKTTHAFSNFLGVGSGSKREGHKFPGKTTMQQPMRPSEINKTWGSADNLQEGDGQVSQGMLPPASTKVKRRAAKRVGGVGEGGQQSRSTPSTPNQARASPGDDQASLASLPSRSGSPTQQDSDSDSAFGFDGHWQYNK